MASKGLDPETIKAFVRCSVPTIVDVLDSDYGLRRWMHHAIKPIVRRRIAGAAVTVRIVPGTGPSGSLASFFGAVDACGPGRIFVATDGGDLTISCMGDLVATALHARGAEGAVMDGAVRDIQPMIDMDFPVFAASVSPVGFTHRATIAGSQVPIVCGGVEVDPGDVIVADWDGVVVIPERLAADVLQRATEAEASEAVLRERIRAEVGHRPLADLFAEFE